MMYVRKEGDLRPFRVKIRSDSEDDDFSTATVAHGRLVNLETAAVEQDWEVWTIESTGTEVVGTKTLPYAILIYNPSANIPAGTYRATFRIDIGSGKYALAPSQGVERIVIDEVV